VWRSLPHLHIHPPDDISHGLDIPVPAADQVGDHPGTAGLVKGADRGAVGPGVEIVLAWPGSRRSARNSAASAKRAETSILPLATSGERRLRLHVIEIDPAT
jgi:hypothetical protein